MKTILKSTTLAIAIVTMAAFAFGVSSSKASNHKSSTKSHAKNPAIDMIVTGSNKNSVKIKNPAPGKNDCGLCYHRDILSKSDNGNLQQPAQAYPGE